MSLKQYRQKRNFKRTPEPGVKEPKSIAGKAKRNFVIHKHDATRLHWDLRLECEGVLKSWAVPKEPSLDPLIKRLAVRVEDHPIEYGKFEGTIPKGNYGAGEVKIWDKGIYEVLGSDLHDQKLKFDELFKKAYAKGDLKFRLHGEKLKGEFVLVRLKNDPKNWLFFKKTDQFAVYSGAKGGVFADPNDKLLQLRPMIPVKQKPFIDAGWIYEPLAQGYRVLIGIEGKEVRIVSKHGKLLKGNFMNLESQLAKLKPKMILDGIVTPGTGKTHYRLQILDLLSLKGKSFEKTPLSKRKSALAKLKLKLADVTFYAGTAGDLTKYCQEDRPCKILARKSDSRYEQGQQSHDWAELVIPKGKAKTINAKANPRAKDDSSAKNQSTVTVSNLKKLYWPKEKIAKGDLIEFYRDISLLILPYLKGRPQSLHRHPNGITEQGFFQKEVAGSVPSWVQTTHVFSNHNESYITYLVCNDVDTLIFMANLGCIEINPWLSHLPDLETPDFAVIDIDPGKLKFDSVVKAALAVRKILDKIEAPSFCKTSGGRGLHIYVPIKKSCTFEQTREFATLIGEKLHEMMPDKTSIDRSPGGRQFKIYIDALQNRRGQTMASVYSVRPRPNAPVSTPIKWSEVNSKLDPQDFTIKTVRKRFDKVGDLWEGFNQEAVKIQGLLKKLRPRR